MILLIHVPENLKQLSNKIFFFPEISCLEGNIKIEDLCNSLGKRLLLIKIFKNISVTFQKQKSIRRRCGKLTIPLCDFTI